MIKPAWRDLFAPMAAGASEIAAPFTAPTIAQRQEQFRPVHMMAIRCTCNECLRLDAAEKWGVKWQYQLM